MPKTKRRLQRESALKELYRLEHTANGKVRLRKAYAKRLAGGVLAKQADIDKLVKARLGKGWDFARLARVDILILRIAVYELMECAEVSAATVINEALELTREFSEEKAVSFVNGVLDGVAKQIRSEE